MTFLAISGLIAVAVGTIHTARLVSTDGLSRIPTRRA